MENASYTMAFWLLRIWLGVRALFTGLTKFQGEETRLIEDEFTASMSSEERQQMIAMGGDGITETVKVLSLDSYEALPETGLMSIESFKASPFMPEFMVTPYASILGLALIVLGFTLLAGICTRATLFLMGLLYISLTYGFIILEPSMGQASAAGIAYLGVHVIMIVGALLLSKHNRLELLPCEKICPLKCKCKEGENNG